jgi:16S rRNA (cytidine1402-2'-O)-methyltransferase
MGKTAIIYLIPSLLDENGKDAIPHYIIDAVKQCQVFFVEQERTARRYLKLLWKEMVIDDYEWHTIHKSEETVIKQFADDIKKGKTIGIISEAGCPGVADPGQLLIHKAQQMGAIIKPLVGPSSILLALMASGLNGQNFHFHGYLPIDQPGRVKAIQSLEAASRKATTTQIFIETPYRNNQMLETLIKTCLPSTQLCVAVNLTGEKEWIKTTTIGEWKRQVPDIHKQPAIFLLFAG